MRKITFRPLSFEKQMTVLLPVVMLFLLLIGVLAVSRSREQVSTTAPEGGTAPSATAPVSEAPPVYLLATVHGESLHYLTVIKVDPATPRVSICSFSPTTRLPDGTAAELYGEGGIRALQTALQKSLSIPLDFYLDFSYDGLKDLVQYYGAGVTIALPQALTRVDETGLPVSFPAGELHLSAYQTYELMKAAAEEPELIVPVASSLWCGMINRYLTEGREFRRDFSVLTAAGDTNIKIFHLESCLPILREMTRYAPLGVVEERGRVG